MGSTLSNCFRSRGYARADLERNTRPHCSRLVLLAFVGVILVAVVVYGIVSALEGDTNALETDSSSATKSFRTLLNNYWDEYLKDNPEDSTFYGEKIYNGIWSDLSEDAHQDQRQFYLDLSDTLHKIDSNLLKSEDKLNYDLFTYLLETEIEFSHQDISRFIPMNQMDGPQFLFPQLIDAVDFSSPKDYQDLISRMNSFPKYIQQIINLLRIGIQTNITLPKVLASKIPDQIFSLVNASEDSVFFAPFLKLALNDPLRVNGWNAFAKNVGSSYLNLYNFFINEYIPNARLSIGVSDLPNGKAFYQFMVRYYTTTSDTPEMIHQVGLTEVARIRQEMISVVQQANVSGASDISSFINYLRNSSQFYFQTEQEFLSFIRDICKRADPQLPKLFGELPKCPYGVLPIPANEAPTSAAAYYNSPSSDCKRPGYYYVNTYDLKSRPKYLYQSTSLHESVPGHHLQIAIQQELPLHNFRKFAGWDAFIEGWALYAEFLGKEMGFYEDPFFSFGRLGDEMFRACRLVVDTGMHYMNWTRESAINYMKENTPMSDLDIISEIDRYLAWPGQALAYKTGELKIRQLRILAQNALKQEFDVRRFHDVVLGQGTLPLSFVEQNVLQYINSTERTIS